MMYLKIDPSDHVSFYLKVVPFDLDKRSLNLNRLGLPVFITVMSWKNRLTKRCNPRVSIIA